MGEWGFGVKMRFRWDVSVIEGFDGLGFGVEMRFRWDVSVIEGWVQLYMPLPSPSFSPQTRNKCGLNVVSSPLRHHRVYFFPGSQRTFPFLCQPPVPASAWRTPPPSRRLSSLRPTMPRHATIPRPSSAYGVHSHGVRGGLPRPQGAPFGEPPAFRFARLQAMPDTGHAAGSEGLPRDCRRLFGRSPCFCPPPFLSHKPPCQ
jgi:hypothetical protein